MSFKNFLTTNFTENQLNPAAVIFHLVLFALGVVAVFMGVPALTVGYSIAATVFAFGVLTVFICHHPNTIPIFVGVFVAYCIYCYSMPLFLVPDVVAVITLFILNIITGFMSMASYQASIEDIFKED